MDGNKDWIDILSALLTPTLVLVASIIAYSQCRLNQKRLKHELFDRRYEVYRSITEFIASVLTIGRVDSNAIPQLLANNKKAYFLFDNTIYDFLEQVYQNAVKLQMLEKVMEGALDISEGQKNLNKQEELKKWFSEQLSSINKRFEDFLHLRH